MRESPLQLIRSKESERERETLVESWVGKKNR